MKLAFLIAGVVAAFILLDSTFYIVSQTEQALITQFGQPVRVVTMPGLHTKMPFAQNAILFDRRLLDDSFPSEEVILSDQKRLIVDGFARFRITNPLEFYQTVGVEEEGILARLSAVVSAAMRNVLGDQKLLAVLSKDRDHIMSLIRSRVNVAMSGFGITVVDVRIRRADLPTGNTEAILSRMKAERERVAALARGKGTQQLLTIEANADRERTVLLAEAQAEASILRGEGEAKAIELYADAYRQDPRFYAYWRTLEAYRLSLGDAGSKARIVISPEAEFLRYLEAPPAGATKAGSP